tara:strand:- start:1396 stop:2616 length:1221 start_codon:yes stop_codon:yes gene_type:complete
MRFSLHFRKNIFEQIDKLTDKMKDWEAIPRINADEEKVIKDKVECFDHTIKFQNLIIGGIDGSGDFPSLSYSDSFVYIAVAQGTIYEANQQSGLKEIGIEPDPVVEFVWIPEESKRRIQAFDEGFEALAGMSLEKVIESSDYRSIKANITGRDESIGEIRKGLIRPHAFDSGNIAIQLRSAAEIGAAIRLLHSTKNLDYLLLDGTMSLPFISRPGISLFFEHMKRFCCVEALKNNTGLFTLSKSHGLPSMELMEEIVREKLGLEKGKIAEHWFLRLPTPNIDNWECPLTSGRNIPPPSSVSYLVRFHKSTPVLRLDMDLNYWKKNVRGKTEHETVINESKIFKDLDYASHDQRCYGYPYPIKAGHDRASLTNVEREVFRKQIIDAAMKVGMRRTLFKSAAASTGHE